MRQFALKSASALAGAVIFVLTGCESVVVSEGTGEGPGLTYDGVTGSYIDRHLWGANEADVPHNPAGLTVAALVLQPNGTFTRYDGAVNADGTFQIPHVPEDTYYLEIKDPGETTFYVTSERSVELGYVFSYRPDVEYATTSPTNLLLNVSGMSAWQPTDFLMVSSPGSGAFTYFDPKLMTGSSGLANFSLDVSDFWNPTLIDSAKGDAAYLTHFVSHTAAGILYQSIGEVFKPAPFSQGDGQAVTLTGAFESVAQKPFSLDWKRSQFAALATAMNPSATFLNGGFYLISKPGGTSRETIWSDPTLLEINDIADTSDVELTMSYGDPFPSDWDVIAEAAISFDVEVTLPEGQVSQSIYGSITCSTSVAGAQGVTLAPTIHPVQGVTVNGASAYGELSGVGATPTLSWSAPPQGTPGHYRVQIRKMKPEAGSYPMATLYTTGTSVTIPEGILESGGHYFFRVRALTNSLALHTRHFFDGYGCRADAMTGMITP